MASQENSADHGWSRRTSAQSVFLFLALSGAFWLAALALWELDARDFAVLATGLGAAAPVLLMAAWYLSGPSVWVLRVRGGREAAEGAVKKALASLNGSLEVSPSRPAILRSCEGVVRVANPSCLVGWSAAPGSDREARTIYLLPRSRDRTAIEALLAAISKAAGTT